MSLIPPWTMPRPSLALKGPISVVVPWFGRYGLRINECGVYRHLGGRFRGVSDVDAHLRIMPGFADLRPAKGEGDSNAR